MKVLVAEDNSASRRMLELMLGRWGFEVVLACDGNEAWQILQADNPPQMAILDRVMPGMDGVSICRRLRQSSAAQLVYVLLLTSADSKEDIVSGLGAGANDYVIKPFVPEELLARVQVGERVVELQSALADRIKKLEEALIHVKTLQGIIPICMHCHKIRDDRNAWEKLEKYISKHTDAQLSHGLCPECRDERYPELANGSRLIERTENEQD